MSVIINDFEIVIEPPDPDEPRPEQPDKQREARLALAPSDVAEVVRHTLSRTLRVLAH